MFGTWLLAFLTISIVLTYQRASLSVWTVAVACFLGLYTRLGSASLIGIVSSWLFASLVFFLLYCSTLRRRLVSRFVLRFYRRVMPSMSRTEREALTAGTVSWEGELFRGNPDWRALLAAPKPSLTAEEQAFLDGPVNTLCAMIDDWDITHHRADLPPTIWEFIKNQGFFALIIPKEYGGKEFSAYAHSEILTKIYTQSATVGSTIAVPNSLGPAELLLHYGTPEQKNYYLPRLARGEEIPCFALTGPDAGSDAGAMTDYGVVCFGLHNGEEVLGLKLNFNKRYITLAPVATVIGLAFKMLDPDHLLGADEDLGITCALIPRNTPGMNIGRRHFPLNIVFQNGPIQGKDVFIPLDWIIGGVERAGQGWRMLMECLAAGRAISLPASATGGSKTIVYASGAYARIRRQFNVSIGQFEGVQEALARIAGFTYLMDATRTFTAGLIDQGARPAIASAITKYHVTELGRHTVNDAMDIHGGKGICLGPKNYLGRAYESAPIAITVEGANILTRCLIIFGQGAMRCHPFIFAELDAAKQKNEQVALIEFDKALMGHLNYTVSNVVRASVLSLTAGRIVDAPSGPLKRYFQLATRFSAAFALLADVALITLGGALKRRETISGRLGDILSYLYLLSAVLKHYQDQDSPSEDLPLVAWAADYCLYQIQQRFDEILKNFPRRWLGGLLRMLIFPYGQHLAKPSDALGHEVAQLFLSATPSRERLAAGLYLREGVNNRMPLLAAALQQSIAAEFIEKKIRSTLQNQIVHGGIVEQAKVAYAQKIITQEELDCVVAAELLRHEIIAVDDFASEELARTTSA